MAKPNLTPKEAIALLIQIASQADRDEIEQGMEIDLDDVDNAIAVAERVAKSL